MKSEPKHDRLYVAFLHYFNVEEDYFECHEVMEELWLEEGRNPLWQGLLQVAVGLYHHGNGNISGAIKLLEAALGKLEGKPDDAAGIDMKSLRDASSAYLLGLRAGSQPYAPFRIGILDPELAAAVAAWTPAELEEPE